MKLLKYQHAYVSNGYNSTMTSLSCDDSDEKGVSQEFRDKKLKEANEDNDRLVIYSDYQNNVFTIITKDKERESYWIETYWSEEDE